MCILSIEEIFAVGMDSARMRCPLPEKSRRKGKKTNTELKETTSTPLVRQRIDPVQVNFPVELSKRIRCFARKLKQAFLMS